VAFLVVVEVEIYFVRSRIFSKEPLPPTSPHRRASGLDRATSIERGTIFGMFCKCNQRVRWQEKSLCSPIAAKKYSQSGSDQRERIQATAGFAHHAAYGKVFLSIIACKLSRFGMRRPSYRQPRLGTQSRYRSEHGSVKALPSVAGAESAENFPLPAGGRHRFAINRMKRYRQKPGLRGISRPSRYLMVGRRRRKCASRGSDRCLRMPAGAGHAGSKAAI
jgi:hypothetical protein